MLLYPARYVYFGPHRSAPLLIADGSLPRRYVHAELSEPCSGVYLCHWCGDVWARVDVSRPDGTKTQWQTYTRCCWECRKKSPYLHQWPGVIWRSWELEFIDSLPLPVLNLEFERHYQHWKETSNDSANPSN